MSDQNRPKCATRNPISGSNWTDNATSATGGFAKFGKGLELSAIFVPFDGKKTFLASSYNLSTDLQYSGR